MTYTITKHKRNFIYNDEGVEIKYRSTREQREKIVLQIIELNPKIPHTHLLEMILEYGDSNSKRPYEELLNELEKENTLISEKIGSHTNAPRLWMIHNQESIDNKQFKLGLKESLLKNEKELNEWEKIMTSTTNYQSAIILSMLLKSNNELMLTAKFGNKIIGLNNKLKQLAKIENQIINLMLKNEECLKYIPNILHSIHKKTLDSIITVVDEISNKPK